MLSFVIDKNMLKTFMGKLIKDNAFDLFEVRAVEVQTLMRFEISGRLDKDFLPESERETDRVYCSWKEIRPFVFQLIKGNKRPKQMKIVLSLPAEQVAMMHPNAAAYFLNIFFENDEARCTVAASEKVFSMDKSIEAKWEEYIKAHMAQIGVVIN